jgi:hypothetical protein
VAVAWVVAPLFLILGVVQAIIRADIGVLGRMAAQLLLVALLTTGAVAFAQLLIGSVDQLSAFVSRNSQHDLQDFLTVFLTGTMTTAMDSSVSVHGFDPLEGPSVHGIDPGQRSRN